MTQALGFGQNSRPLDIRRLEHGQPAPEDLFCKRGIRELVFDDVVESPEERAIQHFWVVRGRNDDALRRIFLKELQKRVQDTANFANVVRLSSMRTESVEFIEEIHALGLSNCIEDQ